MADLTVARTINSQIPVMTKLSVGARDFLGSDNELRFTMGRGRKCIITLDATDTYTVTTGRTKRAPSFEWVELCSVSGVYCDQLAQVIDSQYIESHA